MCLEGREALGQVGIWVVSLVGLVGLVGLIDLVGLVGIWVVSLRM